jgi:hypothetical protein
VHVHLVYCSRDCTPPYQFKEIPNVLQSAQAEGSLGHHFMYRAVLWSFLSLTRTSIQPRSDNDSYEIFTSSHNLIARFLRNQSSWMERRSVVSQHLKFLHKWSSKFLRTDLYIQWLCLNPPPPVSKHFDHSYVQQYIIPTLKYAAHQFPFLVPSPTSRMLTLLKNVQEII